MQRALAIAFMGGMIASVVIRHFYSLSGQEGSLPGLFCRLTRQHIVADIGQESLVASRLDPPDPVCKLEHTHREPLAVIGIGCRLPGDINSPTAFWVP